MPNIDVNTSSPVSVANPHAQLNGIKMMRVLITFEHGVDSVFTVLVVPFSVGPYYSLGTIIYNQQIVWQ